MITCITVGKGKIDFLDPNPKDISIYDIATGLARCARFSGHTETHEPYSVAQHSVFVSQIVRERGHDRSTQLLALLHDASEAYMGDCVTPLKSLLGSAWRDIEDRLQAACIESVLPGCEISTSQRQEIKIADNIALRVERNSLVRRDNPHWPVFADETRHIKELWTHSTARDRFLAEFMRLSGGI